MLKANVKSRDTITSCKIVNKVICLYSVKVGGVGTWGQTQQITLILQNKPECKSETNVGMSMHVLIRGWNYRERLNPCICCSSCQIQRFVFILAVFQFARLWITSIRTTQDEHYQRCPSSRQVWVCAHCRTELVVLKCIKDVLVPKLKLEHSGLREIEGMGAGEERQTKKQAEVMRDCPLPFFDERIEEKNLNEIHGMALK